MPVSSFSPRTPRSCSWCQEPLQGRADKQYCSAACRSMAKRHSGAEAPIDWAARAHAAEQSLQELQLWQQAQQAAAPFEQRYDQLSAILGSMLEDIDSLGSVTTLLHYVEYLLHDYQQHPGLAAKEAVAHQRLRNLQELHATISKRQATLRAAQLSARAQANASAAAEGTVSASPEVAEGDPTRSATALEAGYRRS